MKFDKSETTYEDLVRHFFTFHDPTTNNRQGNDKGTQYASTIFFHDMEQKAIAEKVCGEVQDLISNKKLKAYQSFRVTTKVSSSETFYPAHLAHQEYLQKNTNGYCNHRIRFNWEDVE